MNLAAKIYCLSNHAISEYALVSRISKILKACECSKNLMVGIYLLEKQHFLYCNLELQRLVGKNGNKLLEDGWQFWYSRIDSRESAWIKDRMDNFFGLPHTQNTLTLRYHIMGFDKTRIYLKHEIRLHKMEGNTLAINYFFDDSEKERIEHCLKGAKKAIGSQFSKERSVNISAREKEVLQLISQGFSSKEIATKLFISNHTAISHRKNLIEKFKVRNTAQLVHRSLEMMQLYTL